MKPISVSELNRYVKNMIAEDALLSDITVSGELSNVRRSGNGHIYFTMKEETAAIRCVMFRGQTFSLRFEPRDGLKVLAHGKCSLYEADGAFQLVCDRMIEDGTGRLFEEFERRKKKLLSEGLFDESHKKKLPFLPVCVGAVTSPGGAVIEDIRNVSGRRFPGMPVRLYPCPVQGADAAPQIIKALTDAINEGICDVIIIARGGGSFEDLWCFNDEALARAIYNSPVPVISAVGHETDFTIADFVADRRAPTPSAAAELAVPEKAKLIADVSSMRSRVKRHGETVMSSLGTALELLKRRPVFTRPGDMVETRAQMLDSKAARLPALLGEHAKKSMSELNGLKERFFASDVKNAVSVKKIGLTAVSGRFESSAKSILQMKNACLDIAKGKLAALGPEAVLSRGYSLIEKGGKAADSEGQILPGERFRVIMRDGRFDAERLAD